MLKSLQIEILDARNSKGEKKKLHKIFIDFWPTWIFIESSSIFRVPVCVNQKFQLWLNAVLSQRQLSKILKHKSMRQIGN